MENNIIQFPNSGRVIPGPATNEEVIDRVDAVKYNHVNEALETIIPRLFSNIELAGFDMICGENGDLLENIKDGALIVEAVRSILCKYYDLHHPIQEIAENLFSRVEDPEGDIYIMADELNIKFKSKDSET